MIAPLRQQTRLLRWKAVVLCVTCIIAILVLRRTQVFSNYAELPVYDKMTELTWPWETGHPDIRLITIKNPDIWPLDDSVFATTLLKLATAEPAAVSVDLIRDSYRSNQLNGFDSQRLDLAFVPAYILTAEGLSGTDHGFKPHPFFRRQGPETLYSRVGFANFPRDKHFNPPVRRGIVSVDQRQRLSLPALTALTALSRQQPNQGITYIDALFERKGLQKTSGGYQLNAEEGEQFLLKYGPNLDELFAEQTYSLSAVLVMSQEELNRHFHNKVVFIGTDNVNIAKDEIPVIGNSEFRGVKLLALATSQLMRELTSDELPIQTTRDVTEDIVCAMAAILACLAALFFGSKGIVVNTLSLIAVPALTFTIGCLCLSKGLWISVAAPMFSAGMGGLGTLMLVTRHLRKERTAIAELMQKQIGPEVAAQVWEQNNDLFVEGSDPPETFQGTALFSDLIGYSSVTEIFHNQKKGATIIDWINTYLDTMVVVVNRHHGFIHKFNADGIFVIFGFPSNPEGDSKQHAQQALSCAWEMNEALEKMNQQIAQSTNKLPRYFARVGIYSGDMHSGFIGSSDRFILDFFGTIINKAARLESILKKSFVPADSPSHRPVRILLGRDTVALIDESESISLYEPDPLVIDARLPPEKVWQLHQQPKSSNSSA